MGPSTKIGIGVGVAAGVLAVALALAIGYIIGQRKKTQLTESQIGNSNVASNGLNVEVGPQDWTRDAQPPVGELAAISTMRVQELYVPGAGSTPEMESVPLR